MPGASCGSWVACGVVGLRRAGVRAPFGWCGARGRVVNSGVDECMARVLVVGIVVSREVEV